MDPAITTLCVLAVAAFLFVTELIPLAVTAMAACTALGILGVLPSKQVYAGLSNSTVVLFGGMFVIGAAMFKTGLAETIGLWVVNKAGTKEVPLMGAVMLVTIILSSVSSNTGTVACLIPSFGFFEFALIGVPLSVIVLVYMLTIGRKTIPEHGAGEMDEEAVKAAKEEAGASDDNAPKNKTKMIISGLIMVGVVAAMALNLKTVPLHTAAVTGAILCVITGCLKEKEAYAGIDWVTILSTG